MAEKKIEDFGEKIGGARKDLYALNRELRYGDILDGKRTWAKELAQSNVRPTLKDAVAGDITAAMPYRAMTNIIEFIRMLDQVLFYHIPSLCFKCTAVPDDIHHIGKVDNARRQRNFIPFFVKWPGAVRVLMMV